MNRTDVLAKFNSATVNLQEELQHIIAVLKFQRECLQNGMTDGFGSKQWDLDPKYVTALGKIVLAYQKAVDAKVKLDTHLRKVAETMTVEEEIDSIEGYIKAMDSKARRKLLISCLEYHNSNTTNSQWYITCS